MEHVVTQHTEDVLASLEVFGIPADHDREASVGSACGTAAHRRVEHVDVAFAAASASFRHKATLMVL